MRKWFLVLVVVLIAAVAALYIFIPQQLIVSQFSMVASNPGSTYRCLTQKPAVDQWWTGEGRQSSRLQQKELLVTNKDFHFTIAPGVLNVVEVNIAHDQEQYISYMQVLPIGEDSSVVEWKATFTTSKNPVKRVQQYWQAVGIKQHMKAVLERFQNFMAQGEKVYGLQVERNNVTDTLLIAAKVETTAYPTVEDYYPLIQQLKTYIAQNGVQQTNFPMLNITPTSSGRYQAMTAIPISKRVKETAAISCKRMVPGNILVAEVKGGVYTIEQAFRKMETYASENHLNPPAIPFQALVTDRMAEKDTSRWVTKIYFPVY